MSSKHTLGPWFLASIKDKPNRWFINGKATLESAGHVGIFNSESNSIEEAEANARLIAAAPDLLAALDRAHLEIIKLLNEGDFKRKVELDLGYIVDAIAKAEGRDE